MFELFTSYNRIKPDITDQTQLEIIEISQSKDNDMFEKPQRL